MATPPPPPPELAAAAKRITALEADVANLRRGMVQQLTSTGRIVQLALSLDERHFAGRFLAGRQPTPQEELAIAADILAAAGQELARGGQGGAPAVAQPAMTEVLRSELVAREGELAELRRGTAEIQEQHAQTIAELQQRLDAAEERAAVAAAEVEAQRGKSENGDDERRSDRAEALGLCSELLRLLQANPAGGDDVQITLQVLQESLKEDPALGTVCQAAESAAVAWGSALAKDLADLKAQIAGLDGLRSTAGEWQKQVATLKAELEKSRAEAAKAVGDARATTERSGIIEREITKLQTERETLARDVERLQVELGEQRRVAHEANMARSRERQETEAIRSKEKHQVDQAVAAAQAEAAAAQKAAAQANAEREQVVGRMAGAQERIDRLEHEREKSAAELAQLRRELDGVRAEREAALAKAAATQEGIAAAQAERDRAIADARAAAADLAGAKRDLDAVRSERDTAQAQSKAAQGRLDAANAERDRLALELAGMRRDLDATRAEREAVAAKSALHAERLEAAASERDRLKGELAGVQQELAAARTTAERASGERDAIRSRVVAADGTAEAAMRERDALRSQVAGAQQERDRFRAALEQAQGEHSALARSRDEQTTQLNLRLTEASRQLGELKQVHTRLATENDRLQAELAKASTAAERGRTDAAEAARRAEALSGEKKNRERTEAALAQAQADAREAVQRASGAQQAIAERDAQVARLASEVRRAGVELTEARAGLESERRRWAEERRSLAALLVEAKNAVQGAKRRTEQLDSVQAELARLKSESAKVEKPAAP